MISIKLKSAYVMAPLVRKEIPFLIVFALLVGCCLFADSLPLNDSDIESKWFIAMTLSSVLCIMSVCEALKDKRNLVLRRSDLAVFALLFYIAVRSFSGESPLFWLRYSSFVLVYIAFRLSAEKLLRPFSAIVTLLCTMLALWGIGQWLHVLPTGGRCFPVTGSFDNPAGYASALAVGFPLAISFVRGRHGLSRAVALLPVFLILFAIIVSGSRAGLFAVAIVMLGLLAGKWSRTCLALRVAVCAIVLLALLVALYFLKRDSADGRLLVWMVSLRLVAHHPLLGGGSGAFLREYMPEQACYFQAHPGSRFASLADDVCHPFSEYLSVLIQWGVVGVLLCLLLAVILIKAWRRNRTETNEPLLQAMAALGVFALFSYPLNYPFGWLMLTMTAGIVGQGTPGVHTMKSYPMVVVYAAILCYAFTAIVATVHEYTSYTRWHALCCHRPNAEFKDIDKVYESLYPSLCCDPLFLYNYAAELQRHERYSKATAIMAECKTYRDDYVVEHLWGDIQRSMGKTEEARATYETMSHMCPNRFIPLYRLFQLAEENGDAECAAELAEEIVQKPVKVSSPQVDFIKARCKNFSNKRLKS